MNHLEKRSIGKIIPIPIEGGAIKVMRILIVDEEISLIANVIREMLAENGYHCNIVHNGEEGLQKFKNNKYDLVMLGMHLGDISGHDLLGHLFVINPEQNVIIISQFASQDNVIYQGKSLRELPVLNKPFSVAEMSHKLSDVFSGLN